MATLTDIALDMQHQAKRQQVAIRELARGLRLQLVICGGYHILSLSRPAVLPSNEEIGLCRAAFSVPATADPAMTAKEVTYRWPSPPQP